MKQLIAIVSLNLSAVGILFGQSWGVVNDYTPSILYDIAFASASVGVVVGEQGQVFRTVNGGSTWSFYDLGTIEVLKTAYFADVNRGFILGSNMYQTTNSGATWALSSGPGMPMEGITFVDNQHGTVVGGNGSIYHTTNGGATWIPQSSNTSNTLKSVWFTSANNGIIVGEAGIILQTTDGGISWNRTPSGTLQDLNALFFLNTLIGFAAGGNGTILRTTDGGLNWAPAIVESTVVSLLKVKMIDALNGFAFGNSSNFADPIEFFHTTDGGLTWNRESYGRNRAVQLYGIAVIDPKRCVIVGNSGTLMRTNDGGATWQSQELLPAPDLVGVTAPFSGVLARSFIAPGSSGFTFESSSGAAWMMNRYTSRAMRAVSGAGTGLSAHTSIMAGDAGTVVVSRVNQNVGSRSTVQLRSDLTLRGVSMVDRDTAYIVADSGYIYKSTDQGLSWKQISSGGQPQLNSICFPDAMHGFTVGEGGIIRKSTDFGRSWIGTTAVTFANLNAVVFAPPNIGVIVGDRGTILRTSNGGNSWEIRPSPVAVNLRAAVFANPSRVLAVGDSGRIIGSNDGGVTWYIQPSPVTATLRGVAFLNDTAAVAVGDQRTIVRTASGVTWVEEARKEALPSGYELEQNYPNPFNPVTIIKYTVGGTEGRGSGGNKTMLVVYDVLGRRVATLVDEVKAPGSYEVRFSAKGGSASGGDGSGLASGVYFYRLASGSFVQARKMLLMK